MFSPFGEKKKNLPASKLAYGPVKRVHFKNISSFDSFLGGILFTTPLVEVSWHSLCLPNVSLLFNRFMLLWFITLGEVKVRSQKSEVGSWKAEVGRPSSAFVVYLMPEVEKFREITNWNTLLVARAWYRQQTVFEAFTSLSNVSLRALKPIDIIWGAV